MEKQSVSDKTYMDNPLYPELLAIGGKDKTMRAETLMKYEHLLSCPEVLRKARLETHQSVLAIYASEALREAIDSIVAPRTREVAEAALCANENYEGRGIKERITKIGGMERHTFMYQRGLAFDLIIKYLTRDAPPSPLIEKHDSSSGTEKTRSSGNREIYRETLEKVAERAAALHYAGLATLFAYDFDEELRANHIPVSFFDPIIFRATLVDYLFIKFVEFVYDHSYHVYLRGSMFEYASHRFSNPLPAHAAELLISLHQKIADSSPAGPHNLTDQQRSELGANQREGLDSDIAREVYNTKWRPWHCGHTPAGVIARQGPGTKTHFVETVTPMTADSGLVVSVLTEHIRLTVPVHSRGRLLAHKALANSYEFDEWTPILDGKSLRSLADTYFDSEGPILTRRAQMT